MLRRAGFVSGVLHLALVRHLGLTESRGSSSHADMIERRWFLAGLGITAASPRFARAAASDPITLSFTAPARATLGMVTVPSAMKRIATAGAVSAGDGGQAELIEDSEQAPLTEKSRTLIAAAVRRGASSATATTAATALERRFRVPDQAGRYFAAQGPRNHKAFALAGDTAAQTIQGMLDVAAYHGAPGCSLAAGRYTIPGCLWALRGVDFGQAEVRGAGRRYGGQLGQNGTVLDFTSATEPGIIFQGYRQSSLREVTLRGPGYDHARNDFVLQYRDVGGLKPVDAMGHPLDDTELEAWFRQLGYTDHRYRPQAAVVLDPFVKGPGTGQGYAQLTDQAPDFLGPIALYGRSSGSGFELDAEVVGWPIGVVINPSAANYQSDFTGFRRVSFEHNPIAISIGPDQSRQVTCDQVSVSRSWAAVTNRLHGVRRGRIDGKLQIHSGSSINFLDLDMNFAGQIQADLYGELMWRAIGLLTASTGAGNGELAITSLEVDTDGSPDWRGAPAGDLWDPIAKGAGLDFAPITIGVGDVATPNVIALLAQHLAITGGLRIGVEAVLSNAIGTRYASASERRARRMFHNGTAGLVTPRWMVSHPHKLTSCVVDLSGDTGSYRYNAINFACYGATQRKYGIPHWVVEARPWAVGEGAVRVRMPQRVASVDSGMISGWTRSGRRWTGSIAAGVASRPDQLLHANIGLGRAAYDNVSGTAFFVAAIDLAARKITLEALTNIYKPVGGDGAWRHREPVDLNAAGSILSFIETSLFMAADVLLGDVRSGSASITNLRRASDGSGGWLTEPEAMPVAGDWLYYDPDDPTGSPFTQTAAQVVRLDAAGRTMTMSGPAAFDATGFHLRLFRRPVEG